MVTIAHLVHNYLEGKPFLADVLARGLLNYAALAEEVQPSLEKE